MRILRKTSLPTRALPCDFHLPRKNIWPLRCLFKFSRTLHLLIQKEPRLMRCLAILLSEWISILNTTHTTSTDAMKITSFYFAGRVWKPNSSDSSSLLVRTRNSGSQHRFSSYKPVSAANRSLRYFASDSIIGSGAHSLLLLKAASNAKSDYSSFKSNDAKLLKPYQQPGVYSYQTALCIVPIEEIWDTIQKARHVTLDETIYIWPPSIRLFHPFTSPSALSQAALDTASMVVEKYKIQPFQVVLDSFAIIPYYVLDSDNRLLEALDPKDTNTATFHQDFLAIGNDKSRSNKNSTRTRDDATHVNQTTQRIAPRKRGRPHKKPLDEEETFLSTMDDSTLQSSSRYYEGPCFLCLQPSPASRAKLQKLRNILKKELFSNYNAFAAAASTTAQIPTFPASITENRPKPPPFRPLITLGRFQNVLEAKKALHRLKSFWKPLAFNVTDLHFVSQAESSDNHGHSDGLSYRSMESNIRHTSRQQFECDSLVSLIGEEPVSNNLEDDEEDMLFKLMSRVGDTEKGTVINLDELFHATAERAKLEAREMMMEEYENNESLEQLLEILPEEEEDWNAGGTIVIGRTQFFLGQMREYVGMPASTTMDRILRKGVSEAAQQKLAVPSTDLLN